MATRTVRICDRCGEPESKLRRLMTIGEFLDLTESPEPGELEQADRDSAGVPIAPMYRTYCVTRSCAVSGVFQLAMAKLEKKRSGRGKKKAETAAVE